jgi:taurine dioxygenase
MAVSAYGSEVLAAAQPLSEAIGVEVTDVDLAQPADAALQDALISLFDEKGLVVFRNQNLTKRQLVSATYIFGEPEIHPLKNALDPHIPEIMILNTRGTRGDVAPGNDEEVLGKIDWQTDLAYVATPSRGALLFCVEIPPEGGRTGFIDRQKSYETLPDSLKNRIEGLNVIQSWKRSQAQIAKNPSFQTDQETRLPQGNLFPDLAWPLVYVHPKTGQRVLNVSPQWSAGIVELQNDEGRALLSDLIAHSTQPQFAYWHQYRRGDLVVWDNWRAMHAESGTQAKYHRLAYRTTLKGDVTYGHLIDAEAWMAMADSVIA